MIGRAEINNNYYSTATSNSAKQSKGTYSKSTLRLRNRCCASTWDQRNNSINSEIDKRSALIDQRNGISRLQYNQSPQSNRSESPFKNTFQGGSVMTCRYSLTAATLISPKARSYNNNINTNNSRSTRTAAVNNPAVPSSSVNSNTESGIKIIPFIISVLIGLLVRFVAPIPTGVTERAWTLLSVFVTTISGLVLEPLPVGAWAFSVWIIII